MIKKRLIHLLEDSKKYILQNVLWQWLGLLAQILAVSAIGLLLEGLIQESVSTKLWQEQPLSASVPFWCAFSVKGRQRKLPFWQV